MTVDTSTASSAGIDDPGPAAGTGRAEGVDPVRAEPFGPYLDLGRRPGSAIHARELLQAVDRPPADPVPWQIIHPAPFRNLLAATAPRPTAIERVDGLDPDRRSAAWDRLVAAVERPESAAAAEWAATILTRLGFFHQAEQLLSRSRQHRDERWAAFCLFLLEVCRSRTGTATAGRPMWDLAHREGVWPPVRLLALAATMVKLATSQRHPVDELSRLHRLGCRLEAAADDGLAPDDAALYRSTYWRGASFLPFHDGDLDETLRWLDRAEALAAGAGRPADRAVVGMTLYPVVETRSRVLRFAARPDAACEALERLRQLDPYDHRCLVKLGDTHRELGQRSRAAACYRAAVALGYPYSAHATRLLDDLIGDPTADEGAPRPADGRRRNRP